LTLRVGIGKAAQIVAVAIELVQKTGRPIVARLVEAKAVVVVGLWSTEMDRVRESVPAVKAMM